MATDQLAHPERVQALLRYDVLDTAREEQFDDLAALAAQASGFPLAAITFVDDRREWVKASYGGELREASVERSLGAHAITTQGHATLIADAAADPQLADADWVAAAPHARGYAALPLTTPGHLAIGTLCVLDPEPHELEPAALERLQRVARVLMTELEHRREASVTTTLVAAVGFDGCFKRMSPSSQSVLGFKPEDMVGHRARDFIHPDDLEASAEALTTALAGSPAAWFENRYRTRDGRWRWILWTGHPVQEEQLFYAVGNDITERKCAELALRDSEARYRLLAENATDMISSHTLDGTFLYVSGACRALLGYEPAELIGTNGFDLYHPDELALVREKYERLLGHGGRERETLRFRRKDGSWVWVDLIVRIARDEHGQPILQAAARDVTEARQTLEALQAAEDRFRKAFDDAPIGMAIFGLDRRIQRANPALCDLLGYVPEELIGRTGDDLSHPEDVPQTGPAVDLLLDGSMRSLSLEKRYIHKDGHAIWAQTHVSVMRDAAGNPAGLLGHIQDIGPRVRAEDETRRAREAAERANHAKSEFLTRMSHELRTPLNAVLGFAQLLEMEELTPGQRECVDRILAGGNHLRGLIDDVLDISRIEVGQLPMSPAPVEFALVAEEVVELITPLAAERRVEVRADLSDCRGVEVMADRQRLEQILLNLVSNAIKYGPAGGLVEVRGRQCGEMARVEVVDQGPGIPDSKAANLFVPFERLGASAAIEGTGLGLALSRNLAAAMGGSIGYENTDAGTMFWLDLPFAGDRRPGGGRFSGRPEDAVRTRSRDSGSRTP